MIRTRRADWRTWGTSWSLLPSALEMPTPVGPVMADIIIIARPAPPANWMILRQSRTMGPEADTSTTESPVVVHPLMDSNTALEYGSPEIETKGQAEKRITVTQLMRTMTPPS